MYGSIFAYIAAPQVTSLHLMSFHYKVDEMPLELNHCLYRLAYRKIGFIIQCFT